MITLLTASSSARLICMVVSAGRDKSDIPDWNFEGTATAEEMLLVIQSKRELQQIMSNYVGIIRSNLYLKRAMRRLETLWHETEELYGKTTPNRELCELRNMITVAYLIIKHRFIALI